MTKCYSELISIPTFEGRFEYLQLHELAGGDKFPQDRLIHERFYRSPEWVSLRNPIARRDGFADLGHPNQEIPDGVLIIIHHIDPISTEDILQCSPKLLDPENLITTIDNTHKAIHYGNLLTLRSIFAERKPGDTKLW